MSTAETARRAAPLRLHQLRTPLAVIVCALLAACSSSGGGDGQANTTTSGSAAAAAEGGAHTTEAAATVAKYSKPLTSFNLSPLSAAPPKGKRIVFVGNNTPNVHAIMVGAQEAAKALGWTLTPITFDPSKPTGTQDAFEQAVQDHPDAVVTAGEDRSQFAQAAQQFTAAGIPVVVSATTDGVAAPIIANVTDAAQTALAGRITANYVVAQKGSDADVAMFNVPSFSILKTYETAFRSEYLRLCPACKYKSVPVQITDIGTKVPAQVVSTLQTDPKINVAVMGFGTISLGVSAALRTAGITGVKIVGETPAVDNIAALSNGTEDMWVAYPLYGMGWKSVDALARKFSGESAAIDTSAATPFQILTKTNAPHPAAAPEVAGYQDYFRRLWHVG
jgi:ribose transport system substrate-binding protein